MNDYDVDVVQDSHSMISEIAAPGGVLDVLHDSLLVAAVANALDVASWQTLTPLWIPVPRLSLQVSVQLAAEGDAIRTARQTSKCYTSQEPLALVVGVGVVLDGPLDVCRLVTKDVFANAKHLTAGYVGVVGTVTVARNTSICSRFAKVA
eukprot:6192856-Pleurochrysis_carterae.AAC.1